MQSLLRMACAVSAKRDPRAGLDTCLFQCCGIQTRDNVHIRPMHVAGQHFAAISEAPAVMHRAIGEHTRQTTLATKHIHRAAPETDRLCDAQCQYFERTVGPDSPSPIMAISSRCTMTRMLLPGSLACAARSTPSTLPAWSIRVSSQWLANARRQMSRTSYSCPQDRGLAADSSSRSMSKTFAFNPVGR